MSSSGPIVVNFGTNAYCFLRREVTRARSDEHEEHNAGAGDAW